MKAEKKPKDAIDAEVAILVSLKKELEKSVFYFIYFYFLFLIFNF